MKKEEILAKSREENRNEDEREKQLRIGSLFAMFIAMTVTGGLLMFAELIFLETELLRYGVQLMIYASNCVQCWYLLAVLKKKIWLFLGISWALLTVNSVWNVIQAFIAMV